MASVWRGSISFGLVVIPVKASVAARPTGISFNLLHTCGSRISMKTWCPECEAEIERSETTKGYEFTKGQYVLVSPEELNACAPASSRSMEIDRVVDAVEVDPLLFESSYYLEPEPAGRKGYKLLHAALVTEDKYALAKLTLSGREHVVVIRPYRDCLAFHTLFYEPEVRAIPNLGLEGLAVKPAELALAQQLLRANAAAFDHAAYADGYQQAVSDLLDAKQQGKKVKVMPKKPAASETGDLMAALQASLGKGKSAKRRSA